jgi:uncharacterized hydrophobic protein (TIGR00271 family)
MTDSIETGAAEAGSDRRAPLSRITVLRALVEIQAWWREMIVGQTDHAQTIKLVRDESLLTSRYIFMTLMSAGIAILGLLLSSPAVVIGAMLLSPLMNPIIGTGFALATGDAAWLRRCGRALGIGSILAVLFCALIVMASPLQTVTSEIAARTRPNLFDLLVALFSALAGSYALVRGREGTIVGVAIATALMPPLAVVGFGLATLNWAVFGGALGLFITNLVTIALTAAVMARFYGYRSGLSERQSRLQSLVIFAVFVALAIPLGFSLRTIAWEANGQRIVNQEVKDAFTDHARVDQPAVDWGSDPVTISASVFTPEFRSNADAEIARRLEKRLGRAVTVAIDQFQVGTDPGAAEAAALTQARAQAAAEANERQVADLAQNLALIAGVDRQSVIVDRENKRAFAQAKRLPGLTLEGYRALERRVAAEASGWTVELRPPLLKLSAVRLEDGKPVVNDQQLLQWTTSRMGLPIELAGPPEATQVLAKQLDSAGVEVVAVKAGPSDRIVASWADGTN